MRKDCSSCKHDEFCWMDGYCDDCLAGNPPTRWEAADHYEPDTNADRIRNMTDEELAQFLWQFNLEDVAREPEFEYFLTKRGLENWLKSSCEE